jgi:hypothetical protein
MCRRLSAAIENPNRNHSSPGNSSSVRGTPIAWRSQSVSSSYHRTSDASMLTSRNAWHRYAPIHSDTSLATGCYPRAITWSPRTWIASHPHDRIVIHKPHWFISAVFTASGNSDSSSGTTAAASSIQSNRRSRARLSWIPAPGGSPAIHRQGRPMKGLAPVTMPRGNDFTDDGIASSGIAHPVWLVVTVDGNLQTQLLWPALRRDWCSRGGGETQKSNNNTTIPCDRCQVLLGETFLDSQGICPPLSGVKRWTSDHFPIRPKTTRDGLL